MGLPDDFAWGAITSNVLAEGAAPRSDWHRWERRRDVDASGGGRAFANDPESTDFALLAELGFDHLGVTVEWARVEPHPGSVDRAELERFAELFARARAAGLSPWAVLHHGSLPGWFSDDTDGFRRPGAPSIHWCRQVDRVAEQLDGLAAGWIPSVDPIGWAVESHRQGVRPPARTDADGTRDAVVGVLDAVFDAARLLSSGDAPVLAWFGSGHPESDVWIEAVGEGVLRLPGRHPEERPDLADAFDLLGVDLTDPDDPARFDERVHSLGDVLPGRDLVLCGLTVATTDEAKREQLTVGWLETVSSAIDDGVGIRGAFFDPAIDGYDMPGGRELTRGLLTADREPKPVVRWITAQR